MELYTDKENIHKITDLIEIPGKGLYAKSDLSDDEIMDMLIDHASSLVPNTLFDEPKILDNGEIVSNKYITDITHVLSEEERTERRLMGLEEYKQATFYSVYPTSIERNDVMEEYNIALSYTIKNDKSKEYIVLKENSST